MTEPAPRPMETNPLLAGMYWERPQTDLIVGLGSVPGKPLQILEENFYPAGRGVIPGSRPKQIELKVMKSKIYPDYHTYNGEAYQGILQFHIPRVPYLDDLVNWIMQKVIEYDVARGGGRMLSLEISAEKDWYGIIPTHQIKVEWTYFVSEEKIALGAPLVIFGAIVALLAGLILVWIFKEINTFFHGRPGEPPGIIPNLTTLALVGGGLALAFVVLQPKVKRRKR